VRRFRTGVFRRSRTLVISGLAAAVVAAGLTNPLAAAAKNEHPASAGWSKAADGAWVQIQQPGTPIVAKTAAKPANAAMPGKRDATPPGPVATKVKPGQKTPQLADGSDPGDGNDGDGYVANEYDLQVTYKGGQDSSGVITGAPKVYLIVWGSQWGTASTNSTGDTVMSGDPDGAVPYQQDFFKGLGSPGDGWSGVLTQYCEGIPAGTIQCPSTAPHIQYPKAGSVLAGVWVDNSAAAPQSATETQLGVEAAAAAQHFGNTTEAQNRNVQYVIDSPQGTDPDKWKELGYCAWHDFERSSDGQLAYTNMPYLPDVAGCGTDWFGETDARGLLDGYGIIGGHEYAETLTDPNTPGGWTDSTGQEIADKCSWIPYGSNGGLFFENLSTGSFPLQTLWSNEDHLCMASDPISTGPALTLSTMCDRTDPPGTALSIPAVAADSTGSPVSYSASGLPSGLSINSSTGVISGTTDASANGWNRITVDAKDGAGNTTSTGFWEGLFTTGQHGCSAVQQLTDPGFENGSADVDHTVMTDAWSPSEYNIITPSSLHSAHTGNWYAWLGQDPGSVDSITQYLDTYPGYSSASFSFWLDTETTNTSSTTPDTLSLIAIDQYTGQPIGTVKTWSSYGSTPGYQQQTVDLTPFISQVGWGTTVGLELVSNETGTTPSTAFLVDDAAAYEY
jgi:hypothetical protein